MSQSTDPPVDALPSTSDQSKSKDDDSDPTTSELWKKLQSQGLITSREAPREESTGNNRTNEEIDKHENAQNSDIKEGSTNSQSQGLNEAAQGGTAESNESESGPNERKRKRTSDEAASVVSGNGAGTDQAESTASSSLPSEMKVPAPKRKRERPHGASMLCTFQDPSGNIVQCKQRAILGYRFCIRHILSDPDAPYVQCQHHRKPKSKKDVATRCTNAIRKDIGGTFCSTHLIMQGLKEAKKKSTPANSANSSNSSSNVSIAPLSTTENIYSGNTGNGQEMVDMSYSSPVHSPYSSTRMLPPATSSLAPLHIPNHSSALGQALASPGTQPMQSPMYPPMGLPSPHTQQPYPSSHQQPHNNESQLMKALTSNDEGPRNNVPHHPQSVMHPSSYPLEVPSTSNDSYHHQMEMQPNMNMEAGEYQQIGQAQQDPGLSMHPHSASHMEAPMQQQAGNEGGHQEMGTDYQENPGQRAQQGNQLTQEQCEEALARMTPEQRAAFEKHRVVMAQRRAMAAMAPATTQRRTRLSPQQAARVDRILSRLTPRARALWMASLASRTGMAMRQGKPFPFQVFHKQNPQLATRMFRASQVRFPRPVLRPPVDPATSQILPWTAPPIRPASPSSSSEDENELGPDGMPRQRIIRLRQKRQQRRMVGPYRNIPQVDYMCRVLEDADFDQTDLFPLGLEPSDDEDDIPCAGPVNMLPPAGFTSLATSMDAQKELYLIKKQLKMERYGLLKAAQLNAPIMNAAKRFPTSAGSALLQRMDSETQPAQMLPATLRRCCQVENKIRCERSCLPSSNHCNIHVLYNVNQRMFSFCTQSFCRRPVLSVDVILWDGKCKLHRDDHGVSKSDSVDAAKPPSSAYPCSNPVPAQSCPVSAQPCPVPVPSVPEPVFPDLGLFPDEDLADIAGSLPAASISSQPPAEPSDLDYISEFLLGEGFPIDSPG